MPRIIDGENTNIVGKNVYKFRAKNNMSQRQLSEKLELMAIYICRGSVSRIENGERTVTDIELKGLAEVLKVPIQDLFADN